jgi:cholesterol transport system auxiliary component
MIHAQELPMKSDHPACHVRRGAFARCAALAPAATLLAAALAMSFLAGCAPLLPPPPPPDNVYLLEAREAPASDADNNRSAASQSGFVLEVGMPRARAGFDTDQMVWVNQAHGIRVFARNRWADTPSHMLAPLIAQALERAGMFRAVVQTPSAVSARLRLDTELIRLQQDFSVHPSQVQLALHAQLVDIGTRQVVASAEFDESEAAVSEDAYGGVRAANVALGRLLARLVAFCAAHQAPP